MRELPPTPLSSWAAQAAAARHVADRRRRSRYGAVGLVALAALALPTLLAPAPRIVWNASSSSPTGLYWVTPGRTASRGDRVIAWLPRDARALADQRRYVPWRVPVVKRIAAIGGDHVCSMGNAISVGSHVVAVRLDQDRRGRPMPRWEGCRLLGPDEILLLADRIDSFDGRYFGPVPRTLLIGSARLIWRW